ncbi:DUF4365 domain-containing protein [Schumannella luteola]
MTNHLPFAPLSAVQRQARYGVVYMRALAGQVGCLFNETPPGEDVLAVDCSIEFRENIVRVQVKTTYRYAIDGDEDHLTYTATPHWIEAWGDSHVPVYFVVVVLPDDSGVWLDHHDGGTDMHRTAAYWVRIDPAALRESPTIRVPRSQRVMADTLTIWHDDLVGGYTRAVSV